MRARGRGVGPAATARCGGCDVAVVGSGGGGGRMPLPGPGGQPMRGAVGSPSVPTVPSTSPPPISEVGTAHETATESAAALLGWRC